MIAPARRATHRDRAEAVAAILERPEHLNVGLTYEQLVDPQGAYRFPNSHGTRQALKLLADVVRTRSGGRLHSPACGAKTRNRFVIIDTARNAVDPYLNLDRVRSGVERRQNKDLDYMVAYTEDLPENDRELVNVLQAQRLAVEAQRNSNRVVLNALRRVHEQATG